MIDMPIKTNHPNNYVGTNLSPLLPEVQQLPWQPVIQLAFAWLNVCEETVYSKIKLQN